MSVELGGVVLDDNLQLYGLETSTDIDVSQVITLGGLSVLQTMPREGGRALTLVAALDGNKTKGSYTIAQVRAVKALAELGTAVTLVHHLGTFSVLIVSTAEITPVFGYADNQDEEWYVGPIQLIEA